MHVLLYLILLFFLNFNLSFAFLNKNKCKRSFADLRLGRLTQKSSSLMRRGFPKRNGVCGHVCIINMLKKFRMHLGLKTPFRTPADELKYLIDEFKQTNNIRSGLTDSELAKLIKRYLKELHIKNEISLINLDKENQRISLSDFHASGNENEAIIIACSRAKASRKRDFVEIDPRDGHFLLLAGQDPNNPRSIALRDPRFLPLQYVTVEPISIGTSKTFLLELPQSSGFPALHIIDTIIRVKIYK